MIDKYAEIQDRITLYNACKGILRVKLAFNFAPVMNAFSSIGKAMKPVSNAIGSAGKVVGKGAGKITNSVGSGLSWLASDPIQKNIRGVTSAAGMVGTLANAGTSALNVSNSMAQAAVGEGQTNLANRRTKLENARLDMVEQQLNKQREAMGLSPIDADDQAGDYSDGAEGQPGGFGSQATAQ